ncbi:MAG: hypothetical protein LBQ50_07980 [Planctomycetaceae bacterium]|jgi:hypothetical protein|nr:hypothetical protein [Planctomycetaceae bacterium]
MLTRQITDEEKRELEEEFAKRPPDFIAPDLEELHQRRVESAAKFNHDIDLICDDLQRRSKQLRKQFSFHVDEN